MRILIFNPSYPPVPCGVGAYTRGLAEALAREGHEVTVITQATSTVRSEGPPRVLPLLRRWDIASFLRVWPRLAQARPELVISSFPAAVDGPYSRLLYLVPGLAKLTLARPRTSLVVHEFIRTGETERRLLKLAFAATDRIVAVTEAERDALMRRNPRVAPRTVVRHNAPTIPVLAPDPAADARWRAAVLPDRRPVIAFVGLLWTASKGFEELLQALARTDAMLVASGSLDPDNAYHAHVTAEIERLGLGDRVRWLGMLSDEDLARMLRAADVVALPYRGGAESGNTSLLAALVNGAAVITTRGPLTPPWLRDGETSLLLSAPADPMRMAEAIDRILTEDSLAARLRAGARGLSFGWSDIVEAVTAPVAHPSPRTKAP